MKQRLDQLLTDRGLADSRSRAAALIMAGQVLVDGVRRDKPGWPTGAEAVVELIAGPQYVSRAGLKLESADKKFQIDFKDKVVLDVGSSTGGFSDYALQHGAVKIFAVDVGTHQLHEKLRSDPRVVVMEKTDVRELRVCHSEFISESKPDKKILNQVQDDNKRKCISKSADIALIDVSFISLRLVLPAVARLVRPGGQIIAMCKPQFEAGVIEASKHKGVIKNDTIRRRILKELEAWAKQYFVIIDKADSEVKGAKGNVERFFLLQLERL